MSVPLQIILEGKDEGAKKTLKDTLAELLRLAEAAKKTDSSLDSFGKNLGNLSTKSYTARYTVQNLGNAIRDIPFGIQNPAIFTAVMDHLVDSFGNLKQEAGSTKGAFQLLGQSLAGGGGLIIGFNILSLVAGFLLPKLFGTSEATKEVSEANKKAAESAKALVDSVAKESASISVIVEQLKNENLSRKQREAAIQELQRAAPQYFATLDKEKATIEQITTAYNLYAASVIKAVQAKIIEKQLEETVSKRIELQKKQIEFTKKEVDESGKLKVTRNAIIDSEVEGETEYQRLSSGRGALTKKQNVELQNLLLTEKTLTAELAKIKPLDFKITGDGKEKDVETIADVILKMREQIEVLNKQQIAFGTNEAQAKIKLLESTIVELFRKFKLDPENKLILQLGFEADDIKSREEIRKEIFKIVPEGVKIPIDITAPKSSQLKSTIKEFFVPISEEVLKFQQLITDSLQDISVSALSGLGEAIGNALGDGKDPVKGLFNSLFSSVGQQLQQLGKFLIKSAIEIQVAKKAFAKLLANPVAAIAVGIGLIALGALIKQAIGQQFPGFAGGVRNFRGGVALVGERGPELVTLPRGSNVIPNNQLSGGGLQTQIFIPEMRIAGQDLLVIFNRASQINSRNG